MAISLLWVLLVPIVCALPNPNLGKELEVPTGGPCILNNDKLKCTEKGFYEMVQCDKKSCFCVDAHNGQIAELTRTSSSRVAPTCSACHNFIKDQFAHGPSYATNFVPKCDKEKGLYEKLQCEGNDCFCVDPKTGKEISGSRQKNEKNKIISCDKSESPKKIPKMDAPLAQPFCGIAQDRGHNCTEGVARTMYFFDPDTFTCLAFKYNGCGGNQNRYATESECHSACIMMDFSSCAFLHVPAANAKGETILCGGFPQAPLRPGEEPKEIVNDGCPLDHQCMMGAFFGFCCPRVYEEKMSRAYNPKCKKGKPFSIRRNGYDNLLFGQRCSDEFCPSGHDCHQGEVFAHCCPR